MKQKIERGPTKEFAILQHVKDQTVLKRYCETGSYFGIVPSKLANGRLSWPLVATTSTKEKEAA